MADEWVRRFDRLRSKFHWPSDGAGGSPRRPLLTRRCNWSPNRAVPATLRFAKIESRGFQ